jgi:hypothetical protein
VVVVDVSSLSFQDQYQTPANGNGILVDQRVQGFVKWYNFKNGFGFVTRQVNQRCLLIKVN